MAVFKCDKCGVTKEGRCKPKKCHECGEMACMTKQEETAPAPKAAPAPKTAGCGCRRRGGACRSKK